MCLLVFLHCFFLAEAQRLVWVDVLVFSDAFDHSMDGCAAGKAVLYNREKLARVQLVMYSDNKTSKSNEGCCLCKEINLLRTDVPHPSQSHQPETVHLSYFDTYTKNGVYPHILCLPEYRCIVTVRPHSVYYKMLSALVDEIEADASAEYCTDPDDYRGVARDHSTLCLYLENPADCRPPQSWLEKVVRDQRDWYVSRQTGRYSGPDKFVVESALS